MDETATKRVTEALKRLGDDDRAFVLQWLILYYADGGQMRSPKGSPPRSIVMDGVPYYLVRVVRRGRLSR
jgi:hypothetical protein